MGWLTIVYDKI